MNIKEFENQEDHFTITTINNSDVSNIDFSIDLCGFENAAFDKKPVYPSVNYCLHFIVQGSITLTIDNKKITASKGTVFLLNPKRNMHFEVSKTKTTKYYWFSCSGKQALNYLEMAGFNVNLGYMKLSTQCMKEIRKCLFDNFEEENKGKIVNFVLMENYYKILNLIHSSFYSTTHKSNKKYLNHIDDVIAYVDVHYTEADLTLEKIAKELYLHKNYLSSLFKSTVGCTFKNYLNQKRTNKAAALIREGNLSVNQVGTAVGIPDASYFSKVYKKYNSINPSEEISNFLKNRVKN